MKFSLITVALIICNWSAFSQTHPPEPDSTLSGKLQAINKYVAFINQRKDLEIQIRTDLLVNDTETTITTYQDPQTAQVCKIQDELHIGYYLSKQMVYEETKDTLPHHKTYYENGKILYTTYNLDTERILEITYMQTIGGDRGGFTRLKITKDSLFYSGGQYTPPEVIKNKANRIKNWVKLTQLLKLSDFEKVNSGKSELYIDGSDESIEIVSTHHRFLLLNGRVDINNYKRITPFVEAVKNLMQKAAN